MEDDKFWEEVEQAYKDSVYGEVGLKGQKLWEYAKDRAKRRRLIKKVREQVRSGDKSLTQAMEDHYFPFTMKHDIN